jgi:hypothetical protein
MPVTINGTAGITFNNSSVQNASAVGFNQTWQNLTASRTTGVNYTNSTGRPIMVVFSFYNQGGVLKGITVDGVLVPGSVGETGAQNELSVGVIVPAGSIYSFTPVVASFQICELR